MAWTSAERNKLMAIIGWQKMYESQFPYIDNAITYAQSKSDGGGYADSSQEALIRTWMTEITGIDATLESALTASIVSKDAKTTLAAGQQFGMAIYLGKMKVAQICRALAVSPIGGGYYSQYQKNTPNFMAPG